MWQDFFKTEKLKQEMLEERDGRQTHSLCRLSEKELLKMGKTFPLNFWNCVCGRERDNEWGKWDCVKICHQLQVMHYTVLLLFIAKN